MKRTPKQILLEYANENPGQLVLVAMINGQLKCELMFNSPGEGLLMSHMLESHTKAAVDRVCSMNPATVVEEK